MQQINLKEKNGKEAVRVGKVFTLFISNDDMNDIIKVIKPLENPCVLIDWVTETVKHRMEKRSGGFLGALLASLAASLAQPVISSLVKSISGRGVKKEGKVYMDKHF